MKQHHLNLLRYMFSEHSCTHTDIETETFDDLQHMHGLLNVSLLVFVRLLFEGGVYFGKPADI